MFIQHSKHSIMIDRDKCTGCVVCTLACPSQAIRVKNDKAMIFKEELCIDCGECLRICPHQAVQSMTSKGEDLTGFKVLAAIPSPVLYAQFGESTTPNDILLALLKCGFDYVYDVAISCEKVLAAMDEYLNRNTDIRPMISNYCPAVVRLIVKNYPDLIDHIIPIEVPRELAGRHLRDKIAKRTGLQQNEIGVFHITPCAAKMVSIRHPLGVSKSFLNGAIAIRDVFLPLRTALKEVEEDWILQKSSGVGISWSIGRSGVRGLPTKKTLSITGVREVIQILDDLEAGKLNDIDYLECSICPGGCVGGPLVVQDKLFASGIIENLIEQYGVRSRIDPKRVINHYEDEYFLKDMKIKPESPEPLDMDFFRAAEKMNQIEELRAKLPGKNCGACGAPGCRILAQDVVAGDAQLSDCVFLKIKELTDAINRNCR